jgi:hypothetical protein
MSSSIAIPARKGKMSIPRGELESSRSEYEYGSFGSIKAESLASSPESKTGLRRPSLMCRSPSPLFRGPRFRRGCASRNQARITRIQMTGMKADLLPAASFTKAEHTVINVGGSDNPRLVRWNIPPVHRGHD